MRTTYRLGRQLIEVHAQSALGALVEQELSPIATSRIAPPALRLGFPFELSVPQGGVHAGPLRIGPGWLHARHSQLSYIMKTDPPEIAVVADPALLTRKLPPRAYRLQDFTYLAPLETIAKNFMYDCFDYSTQLVNLRLGQSYIHASSVSRGERALALFGWGGVGKTSAMLKLVLERDWSYLSDDLGLLDDGGTLWHTPKRLQIYAYNTASEPAVARALLHDRSLVDRAHWALRRRAFGPERVRRRIAAEQLLGPERIGSRAALTDAVYLEREDRPDFAWEPLDAGALADRVSETVVHELAPYTTLAAAAQSAGRHDLLPRAQELAAETRAILRRALVGARIRLLKIPARAGPDAWVDRLVTEMELAD